jgi:GNAT superfamily N-acetyltransferase
MDAGFGVRLARVTDAPAIVEFNRRLAWETEHRRLEESVLRPGVEAVLGDTAKGVYFVADADGVVVGQCSVTYEWSDWRNGNIWWFQSVYVEAAWRGRGVFRTLFDQVAAAARTAGVVALRLYVEGDNAVAQEAYRRRGMERTSYQVFEMDLR